MFPLEASEGSGRPELRAFCALGNTGIYRTGATVRPESLLKLAPWPLCSRNHCSSSLRSDCALEITAGARSVATVRSKSLLQPAPETLGARNYC